MIDAVRARVSELLQTLDGIVALQRNSTGVAPALFVQGDDVTTLVLNPRYPLSTTVSLLHKHSADVQIGVVARACDMRALVEMGVDCKVRKEFEFVYHAKFDNGLTEYEYDHVFFGDFSEIHTKREQSDQCYH